MWNGTDIARSPDELRAVLGYLPQDFGVYPHLNAVEFLEYLAAIKGLGGRAARRRIDELLQLVNLIDARKRPLGGFSGGMKQRARFQNLLSDLSSDRIVILSTHIVSDVEATATAMALIHQGQLLRHAVPEVLLHELQNKVRAARIQYNLATVSAHSRTMRRSSSGASTTTAGP